MAPPAAVPEVAPAADLGVALAAVRTAVRGAVGKRQAAPAVEVAPGHIPQQAQARNPQRAALAGSPQRVPADNPQRVPAGSPRGVPADNPQRVPAGSPRG